jgi:hypothetical protein
MRSVAIVTLAAFGARVAYGQPNDTAQPNPPPPDMPINAPAEPAPAPPPPAAPAAPAPADQAAPPAEAAPAPVPAEPAPAEPAPEAEAMPAPVPAPEAAPASENKDAAWLFVGGALTFLTAGAVLAYSTSSAEQDLRDLYTTANGDPAEFDLATQERYDELTKEGRRYEVLSWVSFGVAAACAAGATIFFLRASHESDVAITPAVSSTGAGVSLRLGF